MHLQQTKAASRDSGGPQYYFHEIPDHIKLFLRQQGACPVVLQTPYGIAKSSFMAVGRDHKLDNDRPVPGKVGHDRIQGTQSIGEAIRHWYGLNSGDFERIDLEAEIFAVGKSFKHFILTPTAVALRGKTRTIPLEKQHSHLSFHHNHQANLWKNQIASLRRNTPDDFGWAVNQLRRVVADHSDATMKSILEADLVRTAGALSLLGMDLGAYLGNGYDCLNSQFSFGKLPPYPCPVEVKKRSKDFKYQMATYVDLPRAVILCMRHDGVNLPSHVDILELTTLAEYMSGL